MWLSPVRKTRLPVLIAAICEFHSPRHTPINKFSTIPRPRQLPLTSAPKTTCTNPPPATHTPISPYDKYH